MTLINTATIVLCVKMKQASNYTSCSYCNIFCSVNNSRTEYSNKIFYNRTTENKYSEFFRNISNRNKFRGQEIYTLDSLNDSFLIFNKPNQDNKNSSINHYSYKITNIKYYFNSKYLINLIIKLKTNTTEKNNNQELILNIIHSDNRSESSRLMTIKEVNLIERDVEQRFKKF